MAIEKDKPIIATEIVSALNGKVNTSDVLALSGIRDIPDLTGKIPSAEAIRDTLIVSSYHNEGEHVTIRIPPNFVIILAADGNDNRYLGMVAGYTVETIVSTGYTSADIRINVDRGEVTLPVSGWYRYMIIK